jgi:hypothetical protein
LCTVQTCFSLAVRQRITYSNDGTLVYSFEHCSTELWSCLPGCQFRCHHTFNMTLV